VDVKDKLGFVTIFDSAVEIPQKLYYGIPFNPKTKKIKIYINDKKFNLNVIDTFRVIKVEAIHNEILNLIYSNNFESGE
jgi:hypothetical protein